jgi:hypothetical protein
MPVLDPTFNVIVSEFAPARFNYTDKQYASFEDMRTDYRQRGFINVNVDFSDGTIFGAASVNWQFRAWHDMAHIAVDAPFTADGERAAAAYQMAQVRARYGNSRESYRWCAIIDAEVNAQVAYYLAHGHFVADQYPFAQAYLLDMYGLNLPVNGGGWADGFAVSRIVDRRAAEIAPAVFGDMLHDYRATANSEARLHMIDTATWFVEHGRAPVTVLSASGHLGAVDA